MPYDSAKQRRWMYKNKPEIAERWSKEGKAYVSKTYKHHKYGKKGGK